ncbi:ABC transporter G family member 23-like isoform X2 [Metopolophium dirhodum]|uniref:ABC transporter G family member 23-like isoform X2 n=1 Tax=Metopolophium dirhodum TaxID=44670 RepID=UPI0029900C96|nr:ABC transporter G family member 23-like isoform X2 [Metopolophium dirhodum]
MYNGINGIGFRMYCLESNTFKRCGIYASSTLTIRETFEYYGTLYNMKKKDIEIKKDELIAFLQLPNLNSLIKDISGGQGRRVSLGICLLHNPKLIILDEPTVGIDPLLRQEIWNGLLKMVVEQHKTIIITTHYIEEANLANRIGLMRNGVLVEEGAPKDIISKYGADSLESAFLTLCSKQDANEAPIKLTTEVQKTDKMQSTKLMEPGKKVDFVRIKALLKKNFHALYRDYWLLFTVFLLPIIQTTNFCNSIGGSFKRMEIAIQNDEINISDCKYFNSSKCIFDNNTSQTMSCVAINYLASLDYTLVEVKDRYTGEMLVDNSKFLAFIHFPKSYTQDLIMFIDRHEDYGMQSLAYMHFAKHNMLFKNQILLDVTNAIRYLVQTTLYSCSNNPKIATLPMEINILYGKDVKYHGNSTAAIFLAMGSFYFSSIYSVSIMLSEKMDGILGRSMFAGVTILELLISMFCISNILIVGHSFISIIIAYVLYPNPIILSSGIFMYVILVIIMSWIGFLFGLLAAGLTPTKFFGVHIMNGWALSQMLLSGGVWPIDGQTKLLRSVSELLPMRLAGKTMNDIALKGWTLDHPSVIIGTTATFAHAVLLLLVLIGLSKVKKNMWVIHK